MVTMTGLMIGKPADPFASPTTQLPFISLMYPTTYKVGVKGITAEHVGAELLIVVEYIGMVWLVVI